MSIDEAALERARAVARKHEADLLAKPNVIGVGVGLEQVGGEDTGEVAVVVLVRSKIPTAELAADDALPQSLEGVPVDVQEIGAISAQD